MPTSLINAYVDKARGKCLVKAFIYIHTLCMRASNALVCLHIGANSLEPLLLSDPISTKISYTARTFALVFNAWRKLKVMYSYAILDEKSSTTHTHTHARTHARTHNCRSCHYERFRFQYGGIITTQQIEWNAPSTPEKRPGLKYGIKEN